MASFKSLFSLLVLCFLFTTLASAEPCGNHRFDEGKTFASCNDLPSLNFSLHWNYHSSSHTVEIAIRQGGVERESSSTWIAWAINPYSKAMVGSQALVAFQRDDGTMAAYTCPITSYATQLEPGNLTFPVNGVSLVVKGNEMIIFATLTLPDNQTTTVNHLWQEGPLLVGNVPGMHKLSGPNVGSMGTLDFLSGKIVLDKTYSRSRNKGKIVHGVLCTFGWGFLIAFGALIAGYGKQYLGPAWFYVHVTCQCIGYLLSLGGGIIGVLLWKGVLFGGGNMHGGSHQYIGIILLCLGAIQVLVGYFRPHKEDKNRVYFNVFHYLIGYGSIGLSIANVFLGFHVVHLKVKAWPQLTYIAAISFLVCIAAILEAVSCWKRIKSSKTTKQNEV
ncbi:hypothetical protein CCACVL1_01484 [Corchorus capsularis]|uniref:Cytochrome b561 and DOMON domain-containing protein n=1 Tax=Corchorus capsularis TaxID=210143 RepID=A0A1R3KHU2_COCAP|nr:hypothetical protein CCACVL1_01484 [Corchorus capsularis]